MAENGINRLLKFSIGKNHFSAFRLKIELISKILIQFSIVLKICQKLN